MLGRIARLFATSVNIDGSRSKIVERAVVVLAICFVASAPVLDWYQTTGADIPRTLAGFTARMDAQVPFLMKKYSVPGVSVALIQRGTIAWAKAYGYADLSEGRRMTTDTLLMAQSISKSVTAWGVMKLVEEGEIALEDSVMEYIQRWRFPESEFAAGKVTVRQLLSLSAGLPLGDFSACYTPGEVTPPVQETLSRENARLVRAPGSAFEYSNLSYALLELLVEEVTGRSFAEYMQTEVLVPLGMTNSSFTWRQEFDAKIATGYDLQGRAVPAYVYPYHASGGLFATIEDLARFVSAGMIRPVSSVGRKVLSPDGVQKLYTPNVRISGMFGVVSDSYGLGHFLETLPGGHRAVWHGGQGKGWMTHFHSVPETGDGIVILTNSQRSWPLFSSVLRDWARWNAFGPPGMTKIIWAEMGMRILVGLLLIGSVWQAWRLASGVIAGQRRLAPFTHQAYLLRLGQFGLSVVLGWVLIWSAGQEYLFVFSIFPALSQWFGVSLWSVAFVSLMSACLPEVSRGNHGEPLSGTRKSA